MAAINKKALANSFFLRRSVSPVYFFSSSPTYSEGYHASNEHKRKPDYDKGFNDDRTVADAGDRILEMTEKTKKSMEESMAKTAKKIEESKKKEESSTIANSMKEKTNELAHEAIDEVKKTKKKMENVIGKAKEGTQKIKERVVGKWHDDKK